MHEMACDLLLFQLRCTDKDVSPAGGNWKFKCSQVCAYLAVSPAVAELVFIFQRRRNCHCATTSCEPHKRDVELKGTGIMWKSKPFSTFFFQASLKI